MTAVTRERIRKRLSDLRISANKAAEDANLNRSTLRKYLNSADPNASLKQSSLQSLAEVLYCDAAYLMGEQDTIRLTWPHVPTAPKPWELPEAEIAQNVAKASDEVTVHIERGALARDVPLMGVSVGGEDHDFSFNGDVSQYVERPRGLEQARKAYALYVVGTSMEPAYEENTIIFINPGKPPAINDYVVVEFLTEGEWHDSGEFPPGRALMKRLVGRTPTHYVLRQYNPALDFKVSRDSVRRIERVVPQNELLGFS